MSADERAAGLDVSGFRNYSATVPREFRLVCSTVKELLARESKEAAHDIIDQAAPTRPEAVSRRAMTF